MAKRVVLKKVREAVRELIFSPLFVAKHRMHKKALIRNRKITVPELIAAILKMAKHGLNHIVKEMIEDLTMEIDSYSAAALSKARRKINYTAFKELAELEAEVFYTAAAKYIKYRNKYRVWAVDGSKVNLPINQETIEEFGGENYGLGVKPQALASCLYDVFNHITLDAAFERFDEDERELAANHIDRLSSFCKQHGCAPANELILFDRGYPSEALIRKLTDEGFKFVFRGNKDNFWREVRSATSNDESVMRGDIQMRVVSFPLATPEKTESGKWVYTATLFTNLTPEEMTVTELSELYHLRWGIETNYGFLKTRIEIENVTGLSPLCIRQDFYAAIFMSNMIACAEYDAAPKIKKICKGRKYDYKINYADTYRDLRDDFFALVLSDSEREFNRIYNKIQREIVKTVVPIRPDRHPARGKVKQGSYYRHNHKQA